MNELIETCDYWIVSEHLIFKPNFYGSLNKYTNLLNKYTHLIFSNYDECVYDHKSLCVYLQFNQPIQLNQNLTQSDYQFDYKIYTDCFSVSIQMLRKDNVESENKKKLNKKNKNSSKTCDFEMFKNFISNKNRVNGLLFKKYNKEIFRKYKWYGYLHL